MSLYPPPPPLFSLNLTQIMEESEPGDSRSTNATGILAGLRLLLQAAARGEVDALTPTWSYDLTDLTRQFLTNVFSDTHELLGKRWTAAQAAGR